MVTVLKVWYHLTFPTQKYDIYELYDLYQIGELFQLNFEIFWKDIALSTW